MLFVQSDYGQPNDKDWQRINMRKVAHLIGVEMIHNLYDRYWPQINSIRFRHTVTNYKDGIVESYAPKREWDYLKKWVSRKFIAEDPILIREIEAIMNPTYNLTNEICAKIDKTDLEAIDNQSLAMLLIDIMDFPLGEIYRLNVVQIEYGLNYALDQLLTEFEPDASERNQLLSKLISPNVLTVAQEEEVAFDAILAVARENDPAELTDIDIAALLKDHYGQYAGKHCAYGEVPPTLESYVAKFKEQVGAKELVTLEAAEQNLAEQHKQSQDMLAMLGDERLTRLCNLMSRIGTFRDQNKGKVGETVPRRLRILDEIARRSGVARTDIDFYLVGELVELLDDNKQLSAEILNTRREGVTFIREDYLSATYLPANFGGSQADDKLIRGICASGGELTGTVRIIKTKDDIEKMSAGDIMVAIGTDFDLLEIMHLAGGIITEEGGLLSHASVVSRELGKPCIIGVSGATKLLKEGSSVHLNASKGTIEQL